MQEEPQAPDEALRIHPRDLTVSGTLPGTTDIAINDNRVFISGRSRSFVVNNSSGTAIARLGRLSTGDYGLNLGTAAYAVIAGGTAAGGPLQAVSGVGTSGQVLTSNGASNLPTWQTPSTPTVYMTLLKANSGTSTSAVAANVDTHAITGLSILDSLHVYYTLTSITQGTAQPISLYHNTDALVIGRLNGGTALAAGEVMSGSAVIRPGKDDATTYNMTTNDSYIASRANSGNGINGFLWSAAGTTAWTGSWTLALRHSGVTAGGTLHFSWAVYKIAGQ